MGKSKVIKIWFEGGHHLNCTLKKVTNDIDGFDNMAYMEHEGLSMGMLNFSTSKLVPRKDVIDEVTPWYHLVKR